MMQTRRQAFLQRQRELEEKKKITVHEELQQLECLFVRKTKVLAKKVKKVRVLTKTYRKVQHLQAQKIFTLRFTLKKSYRQISRTLLVPLATVHRVLRRFVQQNHRLEDRRVNNGRNNQWNKITPEIAAYLLSPVVL